MEIGVVGFPPGGIGLIIEKRQESIAPAARDRRYLVKCPAGKYHCAGGGRPIGFSAEFRKQQVAAVVILVEIDRHRKTPMLGAGIDIVAMAMKVAADLAVVAGHDIAIHAGSLELEEAFDRRHQAAHDLAADRFAQFWVRDGKIAPPLEPVIDHGRGFARRHRAETPNRSRPSARKVRSGVRTAQNRTRAARSRPAPSSPRRRSRRPAASPSEGDAGSPHARPDSRREYWRRHAASDRAPRCGRPRRRRG